MHPVLFVLFGQPTSSYGFFMMLAHLLGVGFLLWIARKNGQPLSAYIDMLLAVLFCGLLGARLGYAYFQWNEFRGQPWDILSLQKGGLSFYGGFLPAFFAFLGVLRWRKISILTTSDLVCPVLPFTLGLIRIGCFLQGCCYGAPTDVPWAITFTRLDSKVPIPLLHRHLHPSQLYECTFLFSLALALAVANRRNRLPPGILATISIFAYAVFRLIADQYRGDLPRDLFGVSWLAPTQGAAILGILATPLVVAICLANRKRA